MCHHPGLRAETAPVFLWVKAISGYAFIAIPSNEEKQTREKLLGTVNTVVP